MKSKKSKSSLIHFIFTIIISGFIGGIIGFLLQLSSKSINSLVDDLMLFLSHNLIIIQISMFFILSVLIIFTQHKAKKTIDAFTDDDNSRIEKAEGLIATSIACSTVNCIFAFLCMFGLIYFDTIDLTGSDQGIIGIVAVLLSIFINLYYEITSIKLTKKINPSLKGDPLKMSFEKEYVESCDEAQKHIMFLSSYKAFKTLKLSFIFAMVVLMILQTVINIGLVAPITVAILWAIHSLTYIIISQRESYPKK